MAMHGGDAIILLMLFWSIFLPAGARWSIDALLKVPEQKVPDRIFSAASIALLAQIVMMYECSAAFKSRWLGWVNGDAISYAMNADFWTTAFGLRVFHHPAFFQPLARFTLWFEWIGPVLLFVPWRTAVFRLGTIACFCAFHVGIILTLALGLFPVADIVALLVFLPEEFWEALDRSPLVRRFFMENHFWKRWKNAWCEWIIKRGYPRRSLPLSLPCGVHLLAGSLWVLLVWFSLHTVVQKIPFPRWAHRAVTLMAFDHVWNLFSDQTTYDDRCVLAGRLRNGAWVDLLRDGRPFTWERPAVPSESFPNSRWRIFMWSYTETAQPEIRPYLVEYYCREWNEVHADAEHLESISVNRVRRIVFPRDDARPPQIVSLLNQSCAP